MDSPASAHVQVADDDALAASCFVRSLREGGFDAAPIENLGSLPASASAGPAHRVLVVADGAFGLRIADLVRRIRAVDRSSAIVAVLGFGTIEDAVSAMREGADDVLAKPVVDRELAQAVRQAIERRRIGIALVPRVGSAGPSRHGPLIGSDPRIVRVQELALAAAATRATVLILGESGTGKSRVARAIHDASDRRDRPFIEISCGSLSETLLESELFGHVQGAFTGAVADKKGRFLAADGGTIFLDEINSASPALQVKLLRVLQERRFEPVGSDETREVDVRFVVASNEPLERLVREGRFRQDLYYRINVLSLEMPPLRDRSRDIRPLAEAFLERYREEHQRQVLGFTDDAIAALESHRFEGNVRELEHAVERAVVLAKGHLVAIDDLPPSIRGEAASRELHPPADSSFDRRPTASLGSIDPGRADPPRDLQAALREPERRLILEALRRHSWNRSKTALDLGIDRTTLYKKIRSLGIAHDRAAA